MFLSRIQNTKTSWIVNPCNIFRVRRCSHGIGSLRSSPVRPWWSWGPPPSVQPHRQVHRPVQYPRRVLLPAVPGVPPLQLHPDPGQRAALAVRRRQRATGRPLLAENDYPVTRSTSESVQRSLTICTCWRERRCWKAWRARGKGVEKPGEPEERVLKSLASQRKGCWKVWRATGKGARKPGKKEIDSNQHTVGFGKGNF